MSKKHKSDNSPHVSQRDKIKTNLEIREFPWTPKQKVLIDLILQKSSNIVICKGVSGTAKTLISTYCGLKLLQDKRMGEIIYVRNPCESSSFGLGYLKGDLGEKFTPYAWPLEDKLAELLTKPSIEKLKTENRIITKPVGFIRGASFNCSYIIAEESQNFKIQDFLLLMTRLGKFSKMIFIGDEKQSDIKNGALQQVFNAFNNEESKAKGIHTFEFGKEDIMRNEILSFVIDKFETNLL